MKEGTQRATKGSVEEGVGWGGGLPCSSLCSPLSLSLPLLFVALFGGCGYFCMLQPPDQLMGEL